MAAWVGHTITISLVADQSADLVVDDLIVN
jgi:hypothetical protein